MLPELTACTRIDDHPLSGTQILLGGFSCAYELYFKYRFFLYSSSTKTNQMNAENFFSAKLSLFSFLISNFIFHTSYSLFIFRPPFPYHSEPLRNHSEPFPYFITLSFTGAGYMRCYLSIVHWLRLWYSYHSHLFTAARFSIKKNIESTRKRFRTTLNLSIPFGTLSNHSEWLPYHSKPFPYFIA